MLVLYGMDCSFDLGSLEFGQAAAAAAVITTQFITSMKVVTCALCCSRYLVVLHP